MKIAISADGKELESNVDQRFGRCRYFILADIDGKDLKGSEALENEGAIQGHGAGIKASEQVAELGAEAVITGQIGPNATKALEELGITAYSASGKVKDAIDSFADDKLSPITDIAKPHNTDNTASAGPTKSGERIFFPLLGDDGMDSRISEHFGHAPFFGLYDVESGKLNVIENDLDHSDPTLTPIDQIEQAVDPTTIFAKGIGARAISIIEQKGLRLKTGEFSTVKEAIENLDKLEDQTRSCGH